MVQNTKNNKERNNTQQFKRMLVTGFVGGVLWSAISVVLYYFNFTKIAIRSYILTPLFNGSWVSSWQGDLLSIFLFGGISIAVAIIYYLLFKKYNTMWIGVVYGIALWFIVFYVINPLYLNIPSITELNEHTIVTTFSLCCLYGVFIGYSISFDYNDNRMAVR